MILRTLRNLLSAFKGESDLEEGELDIAHLPRLLGTNRPVILEIGCNDGFHTRRFVETFPEARIYGFEPDARALRRFAQHETSAQVTLVPVAIGAADGTTRFFASRGAPSPESAARLPEGWDLSGSIRPPKNHLKRAPWCTFDAGSDVPIRSLDSWAREAGVDRVDFIWADVQGAESDVVLGGRETLARTRYLYTEYNNEEMYEGQVNLKGLLALLPQFEVLRRYHGDVLLANRSAG